METAKAFKRKMLLWTNNWFQEEQEPIEKFTPDAMEMARLLQATGFRGRIVDFGCRPDETQVPGMLTDNCPSYQVILGCQKSGRKIQLDAPTSSCKRSSSDSGVSEGWTASETASQQMEETLDSISKPGDEISKTVSQVIGGLLHVMSMFPDLNHNNMDKLTVDQTLCSKTLVRNEELATSASNCNTTPKTPSTSIAVITPNAPGVTKTTSRDGKLATPGRYGSLDTLIASGSNFFNDIPEPGQLTPKEARYPGLETDMEADVDLNATMVEGPESGSKKFISNSSPAIYCTEKFQRSSTFNFEDEEYDPKKETNSKRTLLRSDTFVSDGFGIIAEDEPRKGPPPRRTPSPLVPAVSQSAILTKLQYLQSTVSEIIFMVTGNEKSEASIDDVSKTADAAKGMPDDARSIRCLSDFGGVQNSTRGTTLVRSIPRPNIRKRGTTTPGVSTPTTSKPGVTASVSRRKSLSTTTLLTVDNGTVGRNTSSGSASKFGCYSRLTPQNINLRKSLHTSPSVKTGYTLSSLKYTDKISPASALRQSHNPSKKYTHVQSSIPKSGVPQK